MARAIDAARSGLEGFEELEEVVRGRRHGTPHTPHIYFITHALRACAYELNRSEEMVRRGGGALRE